MDRPVKKQAASYYFKWHRHVHVGFEAALLKHLSKTRITYLAVTVLI